MTQGPKVLRGEDGRPYLAYMFNFYLFHWYRDDSTVHLFHGYIGCANNLRLKWTLNLDQAWDRETFVRRAKEWARQHEAQLRPR